MVAALNASHHPETSSSWCSLLHQRSRSTDLQIATTAGQNQSGRRLPTGVGKTDFLVFAFPTHSQKGGDLFQADFGLALGRSELGNVQTAIKSPNLKRKWLGLPGVFP